MARRFDDVRTQPARALQIWQILIAKAHSRQTMTYGQLAGLMGYGGAGVFSRQLEVLLKYCRSKDLPPLTVLVVNQDTGLPGAGFTTPTDLHAARERVFDYDWFGIVPPTMEELTAVMASDEAAEQIGER